MNSKTTRIPASSSKISRPSSKVCRGLLVVLICLMGQQANSQEPAPPMFRLPNGDPLDMEAEANAMYERQIYAVERRMAFHINDLVRTCGLSEDQTKKLRTAAKGAALRVVKQIEKQQREKMKQFGFKPAARVPSADRPAAPAVPRPGIDIALAGFRVRNEPPEQQGIWKNALKKTLTEDQHGKYQQVVADRKAFVRKVAVGRFIAKVDRKLLLSADQRDRLIPLIDKHCGEGLGEQEARSDTMMGGAFFLNAQMGNAGDTKVPIDPKLVEPILDKDQIIEWKQTFEPQLKQAGR